MLSGMFSLYCYSQSFSSISDYNDCPSPSSSTSPLPSLPIMYTLHHLRILHVQRLSSSRDNVHKGTCLSSSGISSSKIYHISLIVSSQNSLPCQSSLCTSEIHPAPPQCSSLVCYPSSSSPCMPNVLNGATMKQH